MWIYFFEKQYKKVKIEGVSVFALNYIDYELTDSRKKTEKDCLMLINRLNGYNNSHT